MKLQKEITSQRTFTIIALIIIALAGFSVYINSIKGEFFWDDDFLIRNNTLIKSWSNLASVFTNDVGAGTTAKYNFYRPLQTLVFMTEYSLWKLDVRGYHLTNIIFHILTALCIYWLTSILFKDKTVSLLCSLIFTIHPINSEAIACATGIANPLTAFFILLCLIFYIKLLADSKMINLIIFIISQILAFLTKENSLILPLLILVYHYAFKQKIKLKYYLPVVGITLTYLIFRFIILTATLPRNPAWIPTIPQRIPGFFVAIINYLKFLLVPLNLHMGHGNITFKISDPQTIAGIIIVISLLLYAFLKRNSNQSASFSILWFFTALLPFSNIYPLTFYMADHFVYLPAIGFFIVMAKLLANHKIPQKIIKLSMVSLLIIYSLLTLKQNNYWLEPIAFYERTLKYDPLNERLNNNLGTYYAAMGKHDKAIEFFKKVTQINPRLAEPYNNIGIIYAKINEIEKAIAFYQKAMEVDPDYAPAYINLGNIYQTTGEIDKAITLYKKAISADPNNPIIYYNLAVIYYVKGELKDAADLYGKAIYLNPDFIEAHRNIAMVYYKQNLYDLAKKHLDIVAKLGGEVDIQLLELLKQQAANENE